VIVCRKFPAGEADACVNANPIGKASQASAPPIDPLRQLPFQASATTRPTVFPIRLPLDYRPFDRKRAP
jgi:hypothetical protein